MNKQYIAHIRRSDGEIQSLYDHLTQTAQLSKAYAGKLGFSLTGLLLGLFHDLGKYHPKFQAYISQFKICPDEISFEQDLDLESPFPPQKIRRGEVDHSTAGAQYLSQQFKNKMHDAKKLRCILEVLSDMGALCIASHHSGLINVCDENGGASDLQARRSKTVDLNTVLELASENQLFHKVPSQAYDHAYMEYGKFLRNVLSANAHLQHEKFFESIIEFQMGVLTRMLFSCLIDADRTNSIEFEFPERSEELKDREVQWEAAIAKLESRYEEFRAHQSSQKQSQTSTIGQIRTRIAETCLEKAKDATNIFSLTIPTGGGKTLASLRFALHHAAHHKLDRIIYIIPFTSIIEQNAQEVRDILESSDEKKGGWVLEQHSNLDREVDTWQSKLVSERWNTPIVFTTMVQFLESCFSGGTKGVRRMHQLSRSVLIFDEIQTLPINCYNLFNNAVNFLTSHAGSSAVLCTATQPRLHDLPEKAKRGGELKKPAEIYGHSEEELSLLFSELERVRFHPESAQNDMDLEGLAEFVLDKYERHLNTLVIVNTKRWASKLHDKLLGTVPNGNLYQLSTGQCAQHRKDLIKEIKGKLRDGQRVLVVSTQLIEAGVDISFRSVVRFMAGLDSVLQAAGRCNRHGELPDKGNVYLVRPKDENLDLLPTIKHGKNTLLSLIQEWPEDELDTMKLDHQLVSEYFARFYRSEGIADLMCYPLAQISGWNQSTHADSIFELLSNPIGSPNKKQSLNYTLSQAFKTAGQAFKAIDAPTHSLIVEYGEAGKRLIADLCEGLYGSEPLHLRLKHAQSFTINLFKHEFDGLEKKNALYMPEGLDKYGIYLLKSQFYDPVTGLKLNPSHKGEPLIF